MAKCIMVQGTASSVGKSLLVAALCRIFKQDGYKVAPFKSQNMALNSFITLEGHEMGRAQVVQAEAAGIMPNVLMNPVLLKPTTDHKCQVIVSGKVLCNMSAMEYHTFKPSLAKQVKEAYDTLAKDYDIIVIEGAGSPAEINLRDQDIVNMGMAEMVDAPVILVGDIDRGGVFASLAGTMLLLTEAEKERVQGVIINKFRGDVNILKPGLTMLEDIIHRPVLGVVPYTKLQIEEEDSVTERFAASLKERGEIDIAVIKLPHMSNYTDFLALESISSVSLRYIQEVKQLGQPDLVIIPGSKNTIEDLLFLRNSGLEEEIKTIAQKGVPIGGICGGYQMLGKSVADPHHTEGDVEFLEGLNLLPVETTLLAKKVTTQSEGEFTQTEGLFRGFEGIGVKGYEIHMGETVATGGEEIPFGTSSGRIFGTYLHGIFDNAAFTETLINRLRAEKGLTPLTEPVKSFGAHKAEQYDLLAKMVRDSLDMEQIYKIVDAQ